MPARHLLLVVSVMALSACASMKSRDDVCPEYRGLRCLTAPVCSQDRARGCAVCRCEDARQPGPPGYPQPGPGTPDRPATEPSPPWTPRGSP